MSTDMKPEDLQSRLHTAIERGELETVRELLAAGADPNATVEGKAPLDQVPHRADDIQAELIVAGAWSPDLIHSMVWAVGTHRVDVVRRLIERHADVNVATRMGTPIHYAASNGDLEIVQLLVEAEADPDVGNSIAVPLLAAIGGGHEEVALCLLEAEADPMNGQMPALVKAAAEGCERVVQWLLDHDADVHATARHIVVNDSVMKAQLNNSGRRLFGAMELMTQQAEGAAPGDLQAKLQRLTAAEPERVEPIVMKDVQALHVAARMGRTEIISALLAAGADASARDGEGKRPRECAEAGEHPDAIARLGQIEPAPASPDFRLLMAAEQGDVEAMRAALGDGASTSARDVRRDTRTRTPLLVAVAAGQRAAVTLLLEAGADPNEAEQRATLDANQRAFVGADFEGF
ncbi:MAG: ankyrin repeat domain-containing protein, partial [Deltaproteobacteria bacterium]|nr:ankyrin repeat domain-containing protein [Deltaproteobacteria bacterium]